MKLTLNIQESKLAFFLELIRNFDFIQVDISENIELSEEHITILEERLAAYEAQPDNLLTWEEVRASIESQK
jgi:hypothetical protein